MACSNLRQLICVILTEPKKNVAMKTYVILIIAVMIAWCCSKSDNNMNNNNPPPPPSITTNYAQTNLVADTGSYGAAFVDSALKNAWGIAVNPTGVVWVSANHTGTSTIYDSTGKTLFGPVAIPFGADHFGGSPTGQVFNATADFIIPANQKKAKFIFANENGTISAWSDGDSAHTVADRSSDEAVYKGLVLANDGTANFLYVANFKGKKVDVFDNGFNYVTNKPFADPQIPADFGPFNIANIGGKLYVTYAKLKAPDNEDDEKGAGNGYIDVFDMNGNLITRFASQGVLNSPWGIAQAPNGFGIPFHSIVVGNFGDGKINVFDSTGVALGTLQSGGSPIVISGLWALVFPNNEVATMDPNKLYFTAGPGDEEHGLFGYIRAQ